MARTGQRLSITGALIPIVFWGTLAICATRFEGYRHTRNLVSELGAAGTSTRGFFAWGLLLCSILSVIFLTALVVQCRRDWQVNATPAWLILSYSLSIAGAAIFPMPMPLHGALGSPSILLMLSPLLALVYWRGIIPWLRGLVTVAVLSFAMMAVGLVAFVPTLLGELAGLKQRIFHVGWSVWFVYLALGFAGAYEAGKDDERLRNESGNENFTSE